MTDKEIVYTVLIGTAAIFIAVCVFLILFIRAYNRKLKEKQKKVVHLDMDSVLSEFKFDDDVFKTTKQPFCRCLYEKECGLPRTKFCSHPCKDQIRILKNSK